MGRHDMGRHDMEDQGVEDQGVAVTIFSILGLSRMGMRDGLRIRFAMGIKDAHRKISEFSSMALSLGKALWHRPMAKCGSALLS